MNNVKMAKTLKNNCSFARGVVFSLFLCVVKTVSRLYYPFALMIKKLIKL